MTKIVKTNSDVETKEFAAKKAASLKPGSLLALSGEMGCGKTCFVQGLAKGLNIPENILVTSPTYVLLHEYKGGRLPLFHFDFYRLEKIQEAIDLNLEEYWEDKGVSVVEWADRFPSLFPKNTEWIHFEFKGETIREIRC